MNKVDRQSWLQQRSNGLLHYVFTVGFMYAFPFVFGLELLLNDFYFALTTTDFVRLYITTMLIAFICSTLNWFINDCCFKYSSNTHVRKM